jgi:pimeloyl-ACP methyl ester carboxylesterase
MLSSQRLKKGKTTMVPTAIQSTWLNVDGLRIHCLAAGESGSAMLLLHGGGLDSAALFLMQECKLWPQREKPEEFNRAVSAFLN